MQGRRLNKIPIVWDSVLSLEKAVWKLAQKTKRLKEDKKEISLERMRDTAVCQFSRECSSASESTRTFFNLIHLFFKDSFIHLKGRVIKREGDTHTLTHRTIFYLLVQFPNGHNSQSWTCPKSEARSFFLVSHMGAGHPGTWCILC